MYFARQSFNGKETGEEEIKKDCDPDICQQVLYPLRARECSDGGRGRERGEGGRGKRREHFSGWRDMRDCGGVGGSGNGGRREGEVEEDRNTSKYRVRERVH